MDRVIRWSLRLVTIAALAVGLWVACRGVRLAEVGDVLRSASIAVLATRALPLLVVTFFLRAGRFQAVLGETRTPFRGIVASVLLAQAANDVLPLRAGELVKTRDFVAAGHPLKQVLVAQGLEKLYEAGTLAVLCAPTAAIEYGLRPHLVVLAALCGGAAILLVVAASRRCRMPPSQIARALAWSFAADSVEVALVLVTLEALGLPSGIGVALAVLGAVNLAIALPSGPAHAGAIEAGAALALVALGVDHRNAVAFAILYRVVQWVPVTLAGGVVWAWRAGWRAARPQQAVGATPEGPIALWNCLRRGERRS
jgi:uncharacterized membrane protein YbhN (UPF0104 family)